MTKTTGLQLQLKKCFFSTAIDYLGHTIRPEALRFAAKTRDSIHGFKAAKNISELRFFFRLCIVYRRFVVNFSRIVAPLKAKLKKGEPKSFELDEN